MHHAAQTSRLEYFKLSPLSNGNARNRGNRIGMDGLRERLATACVDEQQTARFPFPGPQRRGTGGTLIVVANHQRDRGHPQPVFGDIIETGATRPYSNLRLLNSTLSGVTCPYSPGAKHRALGMLAEKRISRLAQTAKPPRKAACLRL